MESLLQQLMGWLPDGMPYLALLFFITFFESLPIIGLIMPGSTLVVFAGFLIVHGKGSLLPLILFCTIGAFLGDLISYWIGGRMGTRLLLRSPFRKRRKLVRQANIFFIEHGGKSLFFARFLGPLRGITPFIAGSAHMKPGLFVTYTLISSILWGIAYPGVGFLGGASWEYAQGLSTRFGLVIGLALIVTICHTLLKRKANKN